MHLGEDDPDRDHAALMQHVHGMMRKLEMGSEDDEDDDEDDEENEEMEGGGEEG